jgi:DinB superfamily
MTRLPFDDLVSLGGRITAGEIDIETASHDYSVEELTEAVRETRGMLQAIADGWTEDQLLARPASALIEDVTQGEDRWSATEAISHLIATENWYLLHMGRMLGRREHFDVMPHGLGDHARQDVLKADLEEGLRSATNRFLDFVASIPADADLTQTRSSTFFGDLTLRGWILLAALHDGDHLQQIQRVAAMATFP